LAGLPRIPVIVRQTPNNELLREALIENIHRSQLNALEEGAAYSQLLNDFNCTQEELAKKLGRSRTVITNTMRLLNLPTSVQQKVAAGTISAGHARALLGLSDSAAIEKLANRIVAEGLSVRTVEEIIAISKPSSKTKKNTNSKKTSPELKELGDQLGDVLDTRVRIESSGGKGEIIVEYSGAEDLQRLVKLISRARS
jgi:ParB family chromosome partitioning protein